MFNLTFLPATIGDAIWVEYGPEDAPHYMLIDGGTAGTRKHIKKKLEAIPAARRKVELVVVSHVDKDHINGIRTLLEKKEVEFEIGDFWYNGFHHLPEPEAPIDHDANDDDDDDDESLGAKQGEALSKVLVEQEINWNVHFEGKAVSIPEEGKLPEFELPGGMKITLLGPTRDALVDLRPDWIKEVEDAHMTVGAAIPDEHLIDDGDDALGAADFLTVDDVAELAEVPCPGDSSSANGSSIAFLAEFDGKKVLFAADAHADTLLAALNRLSPDAPVEVALFKISHHGSKGTTDRALLEKVDTRRFVFSTKGSIFKHPDDETVAKVLTFGRPNKDTPIELSFNYRKPTNTVWEEMTLRDDLTYTTIYPEEGTEGITLTL